MIAGLALFLSMLGNIVCQFVSFQTNVGNERDGDVFFGIWYYKGIAQMERKGEVQYVETCIFYPSGTFFDPKWKAAKSFSILAPVLGGVFWVWICFGLCLEMSARLWRIIGMIFFLTCLLQGLTLLYLPSNGCVNNEFLEIVDEAYPNVTFSDNCQMAWGAKSAIASSVLWFVAGVTMFIIDPPTKPERGPPETQTVTYTKTAQPDGTEVVTSETVKGKAIPANVDEEERVEKAVINDVEEFH